MNSVSTRNSLKGFTLLEVVITMALTSVLFVLGAYIYLFVNARFQKVRRDQAFYAAYYIFKTAFRKDFRDAGEAWQSPEKGKNTLQLEKNDSAINYTFDSTFITRETLTRIDTFRLGGAIEELYYLNDTIGLVSGLRLCHVYAGKNWYTGFNRYYSAVEIMDFLNKGTE